jgi:hypothetical protein
MKRIMQTAFGREESCNGKLDRYKDSYICKKAACKRDCRNPCDINLFVSRLPRIENRSNVEQALAYRISCEISNFFGPSTVEET